MKETRPERDSAEEKRKRELKTQLKRKIETIRF
jgi:hypothetical protein